VIHRLHCTHRRRRLRRVGDCGRRDQQRERGEQIAPRERAVFVLFEERIEVLHARTITLLRAPIQRSIPSIRRASAQHAGETGRTHEGPRALEQDEAVLALDHGDCRERGGARSGS
jgi:hypothetical protein